MASVARIAAVTLLASVARAGAQVERFEGVAQVIELAVAARVEGVVQVEGIAARVLIPRRWPRCRAVPLGVAVARIAAVSLLASVARAGLGELGAQVIKVT